MTSGNPFLEALAGGAQFNAPTSPSPRALRHTRRTILARLVALRQLDVHQPLVQQGRLDAIREAREAGMSNRWIADALGLSEGRVSVLSRRAVGAA